MDIESDLLSPLRPSVRGDTTGCPLRLAMERIAWASLRQHVLYLEGECQPRLELLRELESASALERLVRARICPISRGSPLQLDEIERAVDALQCWELGEALAGCAAAQSCPLDA